MSIIQLLKKTWSLLGYNDQKKSLVLLIVVLFGAIADIVGLSSILPVLAISGEPKLIDENYYLNSIKETLLLSSNEEFLAVLYLAILVVFLFRMFVHVFVKYFVAKYSFGLSTKYSDLLFKFYLNSSFEFIRRNKSSKLLRDVYISTQYFASFFLLPLVLGISEILVLVIILAGLIIYDFKVFCLLMVILAPVTFFFYNQTKRKITDIGNKINFIQEKLIAIIQQGLAGFVDIKLSSKEKHFTDKHYNQQLKYQQLNVTKTVVHELFPKIIEFSAVLGIIVILGYSLVSGDSKDKLIITLSLFAAAAYRTLPSVNRIMSSLLLLKQYVYVLDVIKIDDITSNGTPELIEGEKLEFNSLIKFENIEFSFEDEKNFKLKISNLVVRKGESIGVIGPSGSGKTLLINLLLGFYQLDKGQIVIDNVELGSQNLRSWRNKIGYVQQKVFVADSTIVENVAFGVDNEKIDEPKVISSLKRALLWNFVESRSEGIYTPTGEEGRNMSGGQIQRLAIARALYFDRDVLILDEATSALDNETEREITETLRSLTGENLTVFTIAHRYSTLKYCDRILHLNKGKFEKESSYDDII